MKKTFIFFASALLLISCEGGFSGNINDKKSQEQEAKKGEETPVAKAQEIDKFDTLRVECLELNRYIIKMDIYLASANSGESYPIYNILLSNGEALVGVDVRGYFVREKDLLVLKNGKLFKNTGSEK